MEEDIDYTLLPKPDRNQFQTYGDWTRACSEWREDCERRRGPDPALTALKGGLN
jgi:hypothetical protein